MGKNHTIEVRLDKDELEKIRRKADRLGLKVSTYLRLAGLTTNIEITS